MKKNKKMGFITLALVLGTSITAFAGSLGYRDVYVTHLSDSNGIDYGKTRDSYITATNYGTVYEDHNISSGSRPKQFKADLEYRTIAILPNSVKDTSFDEDGYNEAKDCKSGEEYRTVIQSWSDYGDYTEHLDYDMR